MEVFNASDAWASLVTLGQGLDEQQLDLWPLFMQSFDLFSVALLMGSLVAVGWIVRVAIDIRQRHIQPKSSSQTIERLIDKGRSADLARFAAEDSAFVSRVVSAALEHRALGESAMRDAAELQASIESARWFRRIELLNVIGNLGPLIGLAGTVWGMILAFTSLGATGGQAGPTDLSLGISKALFHTLLGLLLAIPCLLVFGIYRGIADRICTDAMAQAARATDRVITLVKREQS
ncbi:MAG: MotA/TolQ/ExbB proton channel family protein [Leptolyngbya sp. PLA3]|nr:MAG: MotA/TolQ/ExbB proton channel family protein [Cyanobacteria bacterium CYA]MCE7969991.1 MotA/TolQ/ExbB proton channel family protein [Leptolyngbya sp. PL-A3]